MLISIYEHWIMNEIITLWYVCVWALSFSTGKYEPHYSSLNYINGLGKNLKLQQKKHTASVSETQIQLHSQTARVPRQTISSL